MPSRVDNIGMGVTVEMKDAFTKNAQKIEGSFDSLDQTVSKKTENVNKHLGTLAKGFVTLAAGRAVHGAAKRMLDPVFRMGQSIGEIASVGVRDMELMQNAAIEFSNQWAGTTAPQFVQASYDVRSALSDMSDGAVASFTNFAGVTAKATKSHIGEMTTLFSIGYGIYNDQFKKFAAETIKGWETMSKEERDIAFGERFSAGMAAVVKNFRTTGPQMAAAMTQLGAQATKAGAPIQEQLAILGELQTAMGGAEAATLYASFIKGAAKAQKELGISFEDSAGKMLPAVEILGRIRERFGDLSKLEDLQTIQKAFGRAEAKKFIQFLLDKTGSVTDNTVKMAAAMDKGMGFTKEMAMLMEDTPANYMQRLSQMIDNLRLLLGKHLWPMFRAQLEPIRKFVLALQKLAMEFPRVTKWVMTAVFALGEILIITGLVMIAFGGLRAIVPLINMGLASLGMQATVTGRSLALLFAPIGIVLGTVVTLTAVFALLYAKFQPFTDLVDSARNKFNLFNEVLKTLLSTLRNGYGTISTDLYNQLQASGLYEFTVAVFMAAFRVKEFLRGISYGFKEAMSGVMSALEPIIFALNYTIDVFKNLFLQILQSVGIIGKGMTASQAFFDLGRDIGLFFGMVLRNINNFVLGISMFGASLMMTFADGVAAGALYLWNKIIDVFTWIMGLFPSSNAKYGPLSNISGAGFALIKTFADAIFLASKYLWDKLVMTFNVFNIHLTGKALKASTIAFFMGLFKDIVDIFRGFDQVFINALSSDVKVPLVKIYKSAFATLALEASRFVYAIFGTAGVIAKGASSLISNMLMSVSTFFQVIADENMVARPLFNTLAQMFAAFSNFFIRLIEFGRAVSRTLALNIAQALFPGHMFKQVRQMERLWMEVIKGIIAYRKNITFSKVVTGVMTGVTQTFGMSLTKLGGVVLWLGKTFMTAFSPGVMGMVIRRLLFVAAIVTGLIKLYDNWADVQHTVYRWSMWLGEAIGLQGRALDRFVGIIQTVFRAIGQAIGFFVEPIREYLIKPFVEGFLGIKETIEDEGFTLFDPVFNYLKNVAKTDFVNYMKNIGEWIRKAFTVESIKNTLLAFAKFTRGFLHGIVPAIKTVIAMWKLYFTVIMLMIKPLIWIVQLFQKLRDIWRGNFAPDKKMDDTEKAGKALALVLTALVSMFFLSRTLIMIQYLSYAYDGVYRLGTLGVMLYKRFLTVLASEAGQKAVGMLGARFKWLLAGIKNFVPIAIQYIGAYVKFMRIAMVTIGRAMWAALGPWGILIGVIIAIGVAIWKIKPLRDFLVNFFMTAWKWTIIYVKALIWLGKVIWNSIAAWGNLIGKAFKFLFGSSDLGNTVLAWSRDVVAKFASLPLKIVQAMVGGFKKYAGKLKDGFLSLFGGVDDVLPMSDAQVGPFSRLTASGMAIPETISEGMMKGANAFRGSFLSGLNRMTEGDHRVGVDAGPKDNMATSIASAVGNAVAAAMSGGGDERPIVVQIDGREIARAVKRQTRNERVRNYSTEQ